MKRVKRQKIGSKPPGARGEAQSTLFLTAPRRNQPYQHLDFIYFYYFGWAWSSLGFPSGSAIKDFACNAENTGEVGSIPRLAVSPGGRNGNILQYSYLENPTDRGAWRAAISKVTKSQTRLKHWAHTCAHTQVFMAAHVLFCSCGAWALNQMSSVVVACRLSNCGMWA